MKLTKQLIKWFEADQQAYGTGAALYNVLWLVADGLLRDLGVNKVTTRTRKKKSVKK